MGNRIVTMHNLEGVEIYNEDGLILIKGAVPGSKGAILVIRDAIKPKSLVAKVKTDEVVETAGKEKKPESKDDKTEEKKEKNVKEDKK